MSELAKKYDPLSIEEEIYALWQKEGLLGADPASQKEPYCIVIPPPNVTGVLHMGHALNNTLQDILIRWKRMQGYEALWVPGTDHAGIATQNVVEKQLIEEGTSRRQLGREAFLERVWEWKKLHGDTIIRQLKRLGCSCDWERERFTLDEGLSKAVREVFVRLYEEGLIYKGNYIINWCPRCSTALSDEEAEHREISGKLYHIRYPVIGDAGPESVIVATTRPETMLGDTAVAVNPEDERYKALAGKKVLLPLVGRELPVIFDKDVDPAFGTGALKVTPAHDPVDFQLGKKHRLKSVNVMDDAGLINDEGIKYSGMDRFECRKSLVKDLEEGGFLIKVEEHLHAVGHCYRCDTMVEPRLSKQWFVRMAPLAEEALKASSRNEVKFHPARWEKVYLNWMENIRDWCISRQIWWGHRIPVWYCLDCTSSSDLRSVEVAGPGSEGVFVGTEKPEKCTGCGSGRLEQDPDVLDTWFSSWLWPISTLGWPEETEELKKFYPTDALVTAQEIIFFWVARMIMSGLKFAGRVPFEDVYIHGTVRDATGTKMSKSLGNVIDPLDVIEKVGSDALRYSIISITAQGQDVFLSEGHFDIGRNFANKLWNASRFVLMNLHGEQESEGGWEASDLDMLDRWILHSLNETIEAVTESLEKFRFSEAAGRLYDFIWHKYCDWYLELAKIKMEKAEATREVLAFVLGASLKLLHPVMPFITEEIWSKLRPSEDSWIIKSPWPEVDEKRRDITASHQVEKMIKLISAVRNIRAFWNIPHTASVELVVDLEDPVEKELYQSLSEYIENLTRSTIKQIGSGLQRPKGAVMGLGAQAKVFVVLGESIDLEKERDRVKSKIEELEKYLAGISKKLENEKFLNNAPEDVVRKERDKKQTFSQKLQHLKENLSALD